MVLQKIKNQWVIFSRLLLNMPYLHLNIFLYISDSEQLLTTNLRSLITKHARQLANKPSMWGGRTPTAAGVEQLTAAFVNEWTNAVNQLLRHWDTPPTTTGRWKN
jgi:hypothetical protein